MNAETERLEAIRDETYRIYMDVVDARSAAFAAAGVYTAAWDARVADVWDARVADAIAALEAAANAAIAARAARP